VAEDTLTYLVLGVYLGVLLLIGAWSARRGLATAEDYFLAGRSLGSVVLFMALFGTNVTAFAMIGLPGLAYHEGVGVFGFFGATAAFVSPLMFILLGYPIWLIGRRHRFITPSQMFGARWRSPAVGLLLFVLLVHYTLPYLIVGLIGGGRAIHELTGRSVPYWVGATLVTLVAVAYTSAGGMRGTAWTNVFQAGTFLVFLVLAFLAIADSMGGLQALHDRLAHDAPRLLGKESPRLAPGVWSTALLVGPASVIAFPHMFMRLLAARDVRALRTSIALYPWALVLLFVPVTMIGVWGALDVPGLTGRASDSVLPLLVERHLPGWLAAVGLAAILAAVMSSLDGQLLTISTMVAVDLLGGDRRARITAVGRFGVALLALTALLVALRPPSSIFSIAAYSFSGYTLVIPLMVSAFFWARSTAAGVLAASIAGHGLLAAYYLNLVAPGLDPDLPRFGVFPVAICLLVEVVVLVSVSLVTTPPPARAVADFADPYGVD
jgi:SSS family solute:Na+ symporter